MHSLWEKLTYWASQTSDDWLPLSATVTDNPIIITTELVTGLIIALSFMVMAVVIIKSAITNGFASRIQRATVIMFTVTLALFATSLCIREITFFYPIFWVYSSLKLISSISAAMTAYLYVRNYNELYKQFVTMSVFDTAYNNLLGSKKPYTTAEEDKESIALWNTYINSYIESLRTQHNELTAELKEKGLPVVSLDEVL